MPATRSRARLRRKSWLTAKVNGVIGHLNSGTSIPASKIYSDAGIPQISPSATNPKFTRNGYKTTFRVVADDVHLGGTRSQYGPGSSVPPASRHPRPWTAQTDGGSWQYALR